MIFPLGDAPNPRGVPVMTYVLIFANIAVYGLITLPLSMTAPAPNDPVLHEYVQTLRDILPPGPAARQILQHISSYDLFVFEHGFRPAAPHLANLFTALFLHAGFLHLFGNMLFLWIYGDNVEYRLGRLQYLAAYIATGFAATLFFTLFDVHSQLPMIGASGAISGLLGFYFLWFPRNQVRLLLFVFPFIMDVITVPARLVLGMFLVVDNLLPFLLTHGVGTSGVAYGAHIGGFLAGLGGAWLIDRRQLLTTPRAYRPNPAAPASAPSSSIEAAIQRGDFDLATQMYFALPAQATQRVLSPEASLQLANWLRENGHAHAALVVYRRHLRDYPRGPGVAEAHLGAGLVHLEAFAQPAPAYQHFLAALDADPSPETAARARAALQAIAAQQKFPLRRTLRL